jgi:uncharacterized protein (TIGR02594 family)
MQDLINVALLEYGNAGIIGEIDNPEVVKYFHDTGYTFIDHDETPWCSAFLNWVCKKCNVETPNKLNARSFLDVGAETTEPKLGDIVVFWRIALDGPYGHVGLFIRKVGNIIYVLGGNEDNTVKIKGMSADQVLGYRKIIDTSCKIV